MKEKQDLFFNSFLTGSWERDSWSGKYIYMFRPIYGELKGKKFTILKEKLIGHSNWEFSPSTGALKIGSTEYMQGTVVGNTLALLNKKGDQTFYTRNSESSSKRYNLTDVKKIPLNENSLDKIIKELSGQFQYANETYIFEFANEKRTGFVHRFRSSPFSITGETFKSNSIISESNVLYVLDDLVLFEDKNVFKRDSSVSRLKPKTDDEVKEDKINEEKRIETLGEKQVNAIITFSNGKSIEVPLGFDTLDGVAKIELVSQ